ncbi:MAG: iron-sulfur cluster assembly accessory protein [Chloroflexi bacterium]|nr:iron-sulfur cluster assembly accessory protein [Chloroflexota bacterium]
MVTVTETAAVELKNVIKSFEERENKSDLALRVFVQGQCGCGAVHYGLGIDDQTREGDTVISDYGFRILVDSDSVALVQEAQIDYIDEDMRKGFTVKNPNVAGCACGGH